MITDAGLAAAASYLETEERVARVKDVVGVGLQRDRLLAIYTLGSLLQRECESRLKEVGL